MTKHQIKMLRLQDLRKLTNKWLFLISSKPKQFGNTSLRAKQVLAERNIKVA